MARDNNSGGRGSSGSGHERGKFLSANGLTKFTASEIKFNLQAARKSQATFATIVEHITFTIQRTYNEEAEVVDNNCAL